MLFNLDFHVSISSKSRANIARFLRYGNRDLFFSKADKLKDIKYRISADLPKETVYRRKIRKKKGLDDTCYNFQSTHISSKYFFTCEKHARSYEGVPKVAPVENVIYPTNENMIVVHISKSLRIRQHKATR